MSPLPSVHLSTAIEAVARGMRLTNWLHVVLEQATSDDNWSELALVISEEALQALTLALSTLDQPFMEEEHEASPAAIVSPVSSSHRDAFGAQMTHPALKMVQGQQERCSDPVRNVRTYWPDNDGYLWKKCRGKEIARTSLLRSYYNCTYKDQQGCLAAKRVQQMDHGHPPMFLVTYMREHTCDIMTTNSPHFMEYTVVQQHLSSFAAVGAELRRGEEHFISSMTAEFHEGMISHETKACSSSENYSSAELTSFTSLPAIEATSSITYSYPISNGWE